MLIVNCSIIKPTCFRLNVKAESWFTFKSTDVTMTTAHLHIVGALHFRKTQDLTYQWVFFFFFLSECVEPPPCVEAMEPMEPSEVVSGPQRLSQALNTRNNYDFWKFFFFFSSASRLTEIGLYASVLLESPRRPLLSLVPWTLPGFTEVCRRQKYSTVLF